jgi:hypothetical protein
VKIGSRQLVERDIVLMLFSALLPDLILKRRGWL